MKKKKGQILWEQYQVDDPRYNGVKKVSDLTESEAKDELCYAMDLIEKLRSLAQEAVDRCQKENY